MRICIRIGIFANGHMSYDHERDISEYGMPSLANMTKVAIQVLQNQKNGFVLVVEGGLIDQAHHRGWAKRALSETIGMDDAVKVAMETLKWDMVMHSICFWAFLILVFKLFSSFPGTSWTTPWS